MLGKIKYQMKKTVSKKNGYVVMIGIISLFLVIGGFSFAIFTNSIEKKGNLNIVTGELATVIESENLNSNHNMTIKSGESKEIIVTLRNINKVDAKFNFYYEVAEGVNVSYDSTKDEPPGEEGKVIKNNSNEIYRLKIANNTDNDEVVTFGSEVGLYNRTLSLPSGKKTVEGMIPIVEAESNMIKVVWDESKNSWVKASNTNWYDYDFGKWANAVTVTSATRSTYQNASSGTVVNMSDIETMWVYVPRYSYTIGSMDGISYYGKQGVYLSTTPTQTLPGEIDVKFIRKDKKELGSAQYKVVDKRSGWRTPDGFTFGTEELSGVWVGKFETSSSNPSTTNGGGNVTTLDAMIKPNVTSWRYIQVANIAEVGRNITKSGNRYGFNSSKLDSHAMKNSEWALAAYLSQSKYGKLGNRNFKDANKEIYMNKNSVTGCSCGAPFSATYGCQYTYEKNLSGTGASTTGTIYGIYDMNGGAWDYVMADYALGDNKYTGLSTTYNSGYTGLLLRDGSTYMGKEWLEDKYYDFYTNYKMLMACNGKPCISHALDETAGWYGDKAGTTLSPVVSWGFRGLYWDAKVEATGIFSFDSETGVANTCDTFRLVLSVS